MAFDNSQIFADWWGFRWWLIYWIYVLRNLSACDLLIGLDCVYTALALAFSPVTDLNTARHIEYRQHIHSLMGELLCQAPLVWTHPIHPPLVEPPGGSLVVKCLPRTPQHIDRSTNSCPLTLQPRSSARLRTLSHQGVQHIQKTFKKDLLSKCEDGSASYLKTVTIQVLHGNMHIKGLKNLFHWATYKCCICNVIHFSSTEFLSSVIITEAILAILLSTWSPLGLDRGKDWPFTSLHTATLYPSVDQVNHALIQHLYV